MAFTLTPTSLLGAVNELLTAIGTTPVNTLETSGLTDAAIAKDVIEAVSREVQSRGWWFNSAKGVQFASSAGQVTLPPHILSCRPAMRSTRYEGETKQFVMREGKLFDLYNNVFTGFAGTERCDVVYLQDFEQLPESARRYVTVRSARIFQTKVLGDEQLGVFTSDHETEAWDILEGDHTSSMPGTCLYVERVRRRFESIRSDPAPAKRQRQQPQGSG